MSAVQVRLRVVTPLFMAGAEPRGNTAELRAASVRGVLRWWLRALLGGTGWAGANFKDTSTLWQEESLVFGSVEPEPSTQEISQQVSRTPAPRRSSASAVTLYITDLQGRARPLEPTPGRQPKRDYLLYGLHAQPRQNQPTRYYYPPGTQFTLHLQTRLGARQAQRAFTRACAALWLLTAFGGLGARTRRGTGCLAVESVEGEENWPQKLPKLSRLTTCQTPAELRNVLLDGLKEIRTHPDIRKEGYLDGDPPATPNPAVSPFTVLHPDYLQLYVWDKTWGEWGQAMDDLGRSFGTFRRENGGTDGKQIANFITSGTPPTTLTRPTLGLPLPFFFSRLGKATVTGRKADGAEADRSASPVSFHFTRLADNTLALVLLVAYRTLLPPGAALQIERSPDQWPSRDKPTAETAPLPQPSVYVDLIRRFRDYLESPEGLNRPRLWVGYRTKEGQHD